MDWSHSSSTLALPQNSDHLSLAILCMWTYCCSFYNRASNPLFLWTSSFLTLSWRVSCKSNSTILTLFSFSVFEATLLPCTGLYSLPSYEKLFFIFVWTFLFHSIPCKVYVAVLPIAILVYISIPEVALSSVIEPKYLNIPQSFNVQFSIFIYVNAEVLYSN